MEVVIIHDLFFRHYSVIICINRKVEKLFFKILRFDIDFELYL